MKRYFVFLLFAGLFLVGCGPSNSYVRKCTESEYGTKQAFEYAFKADDIKILNSYSRKIDDEKVYIFEIRIIYDLDLENSTIKEGDDNPAVSGTIIRQMEGQFVKRGKEWYFSFEQTGKADCSFVMKDGSSDQWDL